MKSETRSCQNCKNERFLLTKEETLKRGYRWQDNIQKTKCYQQEVY